VLAVAAGIAGSTVGPCGGVRAFFPYSAALFTLCGMAAIISSIAAIYCAAGSPFFADEEA
jgi:hypothetical protein